MTSELALKLLESWAADEGKVHTTQEILQWVQEKNEDIFVRIEPCTLEKCAPWVMDKTDHVIRNRNGGFFSICGLKVEEEGRILHTQPVMLQDEIGYLGMLVREIEGVYHFLMQAKIEPGNINKIQLSPTIQATRSNFTQLHKGKKPAYLDYFLHARDHTVLTDQIQSEQSSRFYKKRNRNMMILVDEEIPCAPNHHWMTLGQIKRLMRYDNLVNMDTRTVLSAVPFTRAFLHREDINRAAGCFRNRALVESIFGELEYEGVINAWYLLNNRKMFDYKKRSLIGLHELSGWKISDRSISAGPGREENFEVIFCRIEIESREVRQWTQPLFKAHGEALFGLLMADIGGRRRFLCRLTPEAGCFDVAEWGPTVQKEYIARNNPPRDIVEKLFFDKLSAEKGVVCDVMLSEEGGRFYHEQNRNVLLQVEEQEIGALPDGYLWLDYAQISRLMESFNTLNIQLRNLLSLLPME